MHKRKLLKPDGRELILYSRLPISDKIEAVSPKAQNHSSSPNPHLRWHPLRGEWVAFASYRQDRIFLPPDEFNPLAPTTSMDRPTELPPGEYDVAVFENLSPALTRLATDLEEPAEEGPVTRRSATGACEVIVFSQNPKTTLGKLPLWHLELILEVWADRFLELGQRKDIRYVMPFENRGVEVGVTLHHPHGQLYAYPFVPPVVQRELEEQKKYFDATGKGLLKTILEGETASRRRLLYSSEHSVGFVPAFARYPYEVWVAPLRPVPSLDQLDAAERSDLARALKTVLLKFDGLWERPFPYLMVLHSSPTDGKSHPEAHLHFEFYPPYRSREKLKYLAGTELGAGMFANDTLPEVKAEELRKVVVRLD